MSSSYNPGGTLGFIRQHRLTASVFTLAVCRPARCRLWSRLVETRRGHPLRYTVRACSMVGLGGLPASYRRRALSFGPLALGNLRIYTADQSLPGRIAGRYRAHEVIAIVNAGATPVLSLPRSEWRTVGLLYDPSKVRDDGA